jgi:predicted small secreted protein
MKTWLILIAAVVALAGCNTIAGMGKDLEKAGESVQHAAKK